VAEPDDYKNWLDSIQKFLKPSKTIPTTSWRAETTWGILSGNQSLQRFLILIFGLTLLWIPLRQKPGFGTIANMIVIAAAIEIGLMIIPSVNNLVIKLIYVLIGILLVGIGSALYITCGLGTGPRDGLMTGLHYRTGVRVGRVRLGIEVVALTTGALLGGSLGVGTALFALLIGQSVAVSLGVLDRLTSK